MHAGGGVADGPSNYFDAKDPFEVIIFIFMFASTIFGVNIRFLITNSIHFEVWEREINHMNALKCTLFSVYTNYSTIFLKYFKSNYKWIKDT